MTKDDTPTPMHNGHRHAQGTGGVAGAEALGSPGTRCIPIATTATVRPPSIRAVVFDLDGLMFNTEELFNHAGRELLRRRGLVMSHELLTQMMGRRPHEAFTVLVDTLGLSETVEELLAESVVIFNEYRAERLAPMPGLFETLAAIERRGLPKGVATSSPRRYLEEILGQYELLERFHLTLTAEDVTHGKPHPEIYLTAAERLGIAPAEMLVLEDSETGTRSAAAAGAVVVSVPHEHSRHHDFSVATR
ncbi:MAG TPA: HAD family phosphatase, partial [Planctomycetaceae bacterium]|nr:HAD family phosphatase [Planctomycetaceae bacterium]